MKKIKNLIIMIIVLVVLIAAFALWKLFGSNNNSGESETSNTSVKSEALISLNAKDVNKIEIKNEKGKLTLDSAQVSDESESKSSETEGTTLPVTGSAKEDANKTKTTWKLENPEYPNVSQEKVEKLGNILLTISTTEDINLSEGTNLADYGIEDSKVEVNYSLKSGEKVKITLGDKAPSKGVNNHYIYNHNTKRLAIASAVVDQMLSSQLDLLNEKIFNEEANQITKLVLERPNDKYKLEAESKKIFNEESGEIKTLEWTIINPVNWKGNNTNLNNLINQALELKATKYIAINNKEDLAKYGLDKSQYKLSLSNENAEEKTLLVGSSSNNETYASFEGSNLAFTFANNSLTNIGSKQMDFFDNFVALVNIENVGELTLKTPDQEYVSRIYYPTTKETDEAKEKGFKKPEAVYTLNGRYAFVKNDKDDNLFSRYYQTLIGVFINNIDLDVDAADVLSKESIFTINYKMRHEGMSDVTLEFKERDDRTFYIVKNGEYTGFYCLKADFYESKSIRSPGVLNGVDQLIKEMDKQNTEAVDEARFNELKELIPDPEAKNTSESTNK